jgi:hypothetical protein
VPGDATPEEAASHDLQGVGVVIDEDAMASEGDSGLAEGSAAGEEVEELIAATGVDLDDAVEDASGFLVGVTGFLAAIGADDGVPPGIGGGFSAGGLFLADKIWGHVRDAVALGEVELVVGGVAGVPEDVVVFGGPAGSGTGAVIVGPDDFVDEGVATEDEVEEDLAVVDLSIVDVEEEAAIGMKEAMGFDEARFEEGEVVVEEVWVFLGTDLDVAVAESMEAGFGSLGIADDGDVVAGLDATGVEGGIDVDQVD